MNRTIGFRRVALQYALPGRLTAGLALKYALRLTAGLVCLLWLGVLAARATDRYVSLAGTNDSSGQYTNWAGAATQIQWAVDFATNGETVWVSNGTYYLTNTISITNSIALRSLNGDYVNTIINGNYPANTNTKGVSISSNANHVRSVLDGFTITNCYVANSWAQAAFSANNILITNCLFTGNIAANAASGACGYAINATISHCRFIGNRTSRTIIFIPLSLVSNCIMSGNTVGASVTEHQYASFTMANCVISSNTGNGVSVHAGDGSSMILSTIVSYNTGIGVTLHYGTLRNCLIIQNGSYGIKMYICCGSQIAQIENCIIANNGDIGAYMEAWAPGSKYVNNSIIYNNKNGNWGFVGTNIVYTNCCTIPIPTNYPGQPEGTGSITNAPLFTDTNIANYRLSVKSPCINAGTNRTWMINSSDLDGRTRIRYGRVDIGAYEYINKGTLYKFQ